MGKAYLLTFHRALNYGAVLQCYALYRTIRTMCDCDVIDYRAASIENRYRLFTGHSSPGALLKALAIRPRTLVRRRKFDAFLKQNMSFTPPLRNTQQLRNFNWEDAGVFCVGSDQVWNLDLTKNDASYFLDFVPEHAIKISYAASLGAPLDPDRGDRVRHMLCGFRCVSVRESSAVRDLLSIGVQCCRNIDPVYLLDTQTWKQMIPAKDFGRSPFVLLYLLQKDPCLAEGAHRYAKMHHLRLVVIQTGLRRKYDAEYVETAGPEEFVGLFYHAEAVFTNSFHGISFSVLFHRLFFFRYQGNAVKTNARLKDSIAMFGLEKQEYREDGTMNTEIAYQNVDKIICSERNRAAAYLRKCMDM